MNQINPPKGTHDIYDLEGVANQYIETIFSSLCGFYGFSYAQTPIFEHTELFERGVGDSSDIVRKEMYTFKDKGDRFITLRPEGTAGIMRAIVSNKLYANTDLPLKYFYSGEVFRYERPQQGRFREFHQLGVEEVGVNSIYNDIEVILLGYSILQTLGLKDVKLKINSLGDKQSRDNYRAALKDFFSDKIDDMCEDCHDRYNTNPLRILDCKVEHDQEIVRHAPIMRNYLTEKAETDFVETLEVLNAFGIPYEVDNNLVRGLDYYSGVVFEFHYTSKTGQNYGAIGAGGHYDHLVEEIGGPALEGIGFAFGLERLYAVMRDDSLLEGIDEGLDFYVMSVGTKSFTDAFSLLTSLRASGFKCESSFDGKGFKQLFKRANRKKAKFAIIIGDDEVDKEVVTIKNMLTEEQFMVPYAQVIDKADELIDELEAHHHHHE
ncbi:MAG: histidine--tRNA ligase [Bacilli bacterium]|jgi:histidyl-tRNA synthetase|nr:histidine--tRNA ligase [Bacilli bacterium]MCH4235325.1 histidine--tRNA ligase [Bacilli bacterium]